MEGVAVGVTAELTVKVELAALFVSMVVPPLMNLTVDVVL